MRHCSKRNKLKVWSKTLGKKRLSRVSLGYALAAATVASSMANVNRVCSHSFASFGNELGKVSKPMAAASMVIATFNGVNNILNEYKSGRKTRSEK
jgi:hypothetical protein